MEKTNRITTIGKRGITTYRLLSTASALFLILSTTNALAQTEFNGSLKNVSITDAAGANIPPTGKFTYTQDGDTFIFDANDSSDSDGSIIQYKWDLGGSATGTGISTSAEFAPGKYVVTLTVIDNSGGVSITQSSISYTTELNYSINFQPASATVPTDFLAASDNAFDSSQGFGWKIGPSSDGARDRNNDISPNQAYDTMMHVAPSSVWEISVPNGSYSVTVYNGDASYPTGTQNVQAEGTTVIDNKPLSYSQRWVEGTANVTVSDGRLTITFSGSTDPARICWLTITSI